MKKRVDLLSHQLKFMKSQKRFAALIGGVGSGKSHAGTIYIIMRVIQYPKALHFIGANTYAQLRDATLNTLFKNLNALEIDYTFNQNAGIVEFADGKVLCKSMDNFDAIRGIEIGSFLLDEARDTKREAFDVMMGRLRDRNVDSLQGRITTSPAGFNWIYDYFHKDGEKNNENFELIHATSHDNIYLPKGYIDSIKSQYTEDYYQQEILGQFVRGGRGTIFPWIIRAERPAWDLVKPRDIHKWNFIVGLDPASTSIFAVVFAIHNPFSKKVIIFDEIYESDPSKMTTRQMWAQIDQKLKPYKSIIKNIDFVYDEAAAWWANESNEVKQEYWQIPSKKSRYGVEGYINLVRIFMNNDLLTITNNCDATWKELDGYQMDENGRIPKARDHAINAIMYFLGNIGHDLAESTEKKPYVDDTRRGYSMDSELFNDEMSFRELE